MKLLKNITYTATLIISTMAIGMNPYNTLGLPEELWFKIFIILPSKHQCLLASTNSPLKKFYDTHIEHMNGCNFCIIPIQKGIWIAITNMLFWQNPEKLATERSAGFFNAIAENKIGGSVNFRYTKQPKDSLYTIDPTFDRLHRTLSTNNRITQLDISDCLLNDVELTTLAQSITIQDNSVLKSLVLRNNQVTYAGIRNALTFLPDLESLDASDNHYFTKCISSRTDRYNTLECNATSINLSTLNILNLKKLALNNCKISSSQAVWLFEPLRTGAKLEELGLAQNHIIDNTVISVFKLLQKTYGFPEIDLSGQTPKNLAQLLRKAQTH